jgi:hypothetical protein
MLHHSILYDINSELLDDNYHFAMVLNLAFPSIVICYCSSLLSIPLVFSELFWTLNSKLMEEYGIGAQEVRFSIDIIRPVYYRAYDSIFCPTFFFSNFTMSS